MRKLVTLITFSLLILMGCEKSRIQDTMNQLEGNWIVESYKLNNKEYLRENKYQDWQVTITSQDYDEGYWMQSRYFDTLFLSNSMPFTLSEPYEIIFGSDWENGLEKMMHTYEIIVDGDNIIMTDNNTYLSMNRND